MARAELLKQLFRAYRNSDRELFMEAARAIAEEEKEKRHSSLANELLRILNNGTPVASPLLRSPFPQPPKDQDRRLSLLDIKTPDRFLRDLILEERTIRTLKKVIREFRAWDTLLSSGLRPSNKLLFCGPPGCGKTATAEAMAGELGIPMLYVRFDSVVSSLLGETAANLRRIFDYAAQDTWVILFDEFDAIGRSRDDLTEHGELKRVVNAFLQLLDSFTGRSIVIAATNFEEALDPALWRRFDEIVRFNRPSLPQIEQLLKRRLAHMNSHKVNFSKYLPQLEGSSFADVERVALHILKECALQGRIEFSEQDLAIAIDNLTERRTILQGLRTSPTPRIEHP
jgi:SpoVK/Ycf46/Vps4 family AAA+-type ATPase